MIVSASYRTDIPAHYGRWFARRLEAGFCRVASPYGGPPALVRLDAQAVDGFVFWTRNLSPFFPALDAVTARGIPFVVHYTVTAYPRALEAATITPGRALAHLARLRRDFGPRAGVWRYDPIVMSTLTPPDWHAATFARLARALAGAVDEVVVSFLQVYRKTARNLDAAASAHGFQWRDVEAGEKRRLLATLAALASDHGMRLTLCAQPELAIAGVAEAACIDAKRLSDVAGRAIAAAPKPHRRCGCAQSRDIGAYDSCAQGCAYCYAVASRAAAARRLARHDPEGEFLVPPGRGGERARAP